MPFPSWADDTVIVQRAARVVDHNVLVVDWSQTPTETPVEGCSFQPASGVEDINHRTAVSGPAQVFMPAGTDITGLDRVKFDGDTYEVVGKPQKWRSPSGNLDHTLVTLTSWEG